MDRNGSTNLNWGYIEPPPPSTTSSLKSHLSLKLMSFMSENPPFSRNVTDRTPDPRIPVEYFVNQNREDAKLINHHRSYYDQLNPDISHDQPSSSSAAHSAQMLKQPKIENVIPHVEEVVSEEIDNGISNGLVKKRGRGKDGKCSVEEKKPRTRGPRVPKDGSATVVKRVRVPMKCVEVVINGVSFDISDIPVPICSCTGNPRQCYRWGSGGWQSSCCTTSVSMYPLPRNTKRRGGRIAGRKMSIGAFKKVLEKLSSEGYDFSDPIDLKNYWAKHGTNKFMTIR